MTDRWGPSEDCQVCGQPKSFGFPCRTCDLELRRMQEEQEEEDHDERGMHTEDN